MYVSIILRLPDKVCDNSFTWSVTRGAHIAHRTWARVVSYTSTMDTWRIANSWR